MDNFRVKANIEMTATITRRELATALMQEILSLTGVGDDAGCDWQTNETLRWEGEKFDIPYRKTCIGSPAWIVSRNTQVATLVDAYNILIYGSPIHVEIEDDEDNDHA